MENQIEKKFQEIFKFFFIESFMSMNVLYTYQIYKTFNCDLLQFFFVRTISVLFLFKSLHSLDIQQQQRKKELMILMRCKVL